MAANGHTAWVKLLEIFGALLAIALVIAIAVLSFWSYRNEKKPPNQAFNGGHYPEQPLNGPYKGTFTSMTGWQGKEFDAPNNSGINLFDGNQKRYVFSTYKAKSLKSNNEVLKIDYNNSANPLWLRFVVDELVQVSESEYQGKVLIKIGPLSFTMAYFSLEGS